MSRITVTPEQLKSQALTYTTEADELDQILSTLKNMNSQIEAEWDGEAFRAFNGEFEAKHSPNIKALSEALRDVKARIDAAASNFEEQDQSNANMFQG